MSIIFKETNKKISFSKVNLKEFFEFYREEICKYNFKYVLEDDTELVIDFKERNFSHIIGLHKFEKMKKYKSAEEINRDILNEKIIFKELRLNEKDVLKKNEELGDRISYFPVLKTLLKSANRALKYNLNVIWNSKIEFSFLLRTNKITVLVYLAVKEIKGNKKICVPVSLLVDRKDRFYKMKLKELKIKEIYVEKK